MTLERKRGTGQCVSKFRLIQCLGSKALRPGSARSHMPQRHADKSSVMHYVVNEDFDSILFAHEARHRTRWPTVSVVLDQHHARRLYVPPANLQERRTSPGSWRMDQERSEYHGIE